jgi:hypothetical protein
MGTKDERHFIWYEVGVKRSASFEVVHDSREVCTRSSGRSKRSDDRSYANKYRRKSMFELVILSRKVSSMRNM